MCGLSVQNKNHAFTPLIFEKLHLEARSWTCLFSWSSAIRLSDREIRNLSKSLDFELPSRSYRPASRSTGWNMIVVARATPSLSYFLKCIIIIASCMGSVAASSFHRWHATSQTRAEIDARPSALPPRQETYKQTSIFNPYDESPLRSGERGLFVGAVRVLTCEFMRYTWDIN